MILSVLVFFLCAGLESHSLYRVPWEDAYRYIDKNFSHPQRVARVDITADIPYDRDELAYLVGLRPGDYVTTQALKKALFYLKEKGVFSSVFLTLQPNKDEVILKFFCKGLYRVGRVKITGILFGRDYYWHLYAGAPGESFSLQKHNHSLQRIKQELFSQGYLDARIRDTVVYNRHTKTVSLILHIHKGRLYKIHEVAFVVAKPADKNIENSLLRYFRKHVLQKGVTDDFLLLYTKQIKEFLSQQGYPFAQVSVTHYFCRTTKKVKLVFTISHCEKQCYRFEGNSALSDQFLLHALIKKHHPHWKAPSQILVNELQTLYKNYGYHGVVIRAVERKNHCIYFHILEGERTKIRSVEVRGATMMSSALLVKKFFKRLLARRFFDKRLEQESIKRLVNWYVEQGFWEAQVVGSKLEPVRNSLNNSNLILALDEGKRRLIKGMVLVDGEEELLREIFRPAYPCTTRNLQKLRKKLPYRLVSKEEIALSQLIEEEDGVVVCWEIKKEGEGKKLGKVVLQGNGNIPFRGLLRLLGGKDKSYYTRKDLDRAFVRLRSLGVFDAVHVHPASDPDPDGVRPLITQLVTDNALEIRSRIGFQKISKNFAFKSGTTYKAGVSVYYKNPTGRADQLRFDADTTRFYRELTATYSRPLLPHYPLHFTTRVYANKYDQPIFIGSKERLYQIFQQGGLVEFGLKEDYTRFGSTFGIEGIKVSHLSLPYARAIDFSDAMLAKRVPFFFAEPTLFFDRVDDRLNPLRGVQTLLSVKGMWSLGKEESYFVKLLFEQSLYYPLGYEVTCALRFRFGYIMTNSFTTVVPIERFYLGGANSLRSYEPDFAPPLGKVTIDGKEILVPQGGKTMFNANIETRFPIYGQLGGVVFQDIGLLGKPNAAMAELPLLTATGFGIRYYTPLGPLRFDIGWRRKQYPADSNFAWFLTLGHAF